MTDDRSLAALDQRGRAAAAGLRADVSRRPAPPFDPDVVRIDIGGHGGAPDGRRRGLALLATAAVVVLVVGGAVALAGRSDDDGGPADGVGTGELDRFVLGAVPDGYALADVTDGSEPATGDTGLDGAATVYGPSEDRPLVAVAPIPEDEGQEPDEATPGDVPPEVEGLAEVEVPGRRGWDASESLGDGALLVEVGERVVLVIGAGDDRARVAAAAAVTLDGDRASVPGEALPDDWSRLGEVTLGEAVGSLYVQSGLARAVRWSATYAPDGETFELVTVSVDEGGPLDVGLGRLLTEDVEEIEVRGQPAVLTRQDLATPTATVWFTLRWEERPGEVVEVVVASSGRFDREDTIALAEGLVAVTPEEVPGLRAEARAFGLDAPGVVIVGQGRFSDGTGWTLASEPAEDGTGVRFELRTDADASESSSSSSGGSPTTVAMESGPGAEEVAPPDPFADGVSASASDAYGWAYGAVRSDVAEVEVREPDGTVLAAAPVLTADGLTAFVVELPTGLPTGDGGAASGIRLVALDAAGTELGEMPL